MPRRFFAVMIFLISFLPAPMQRSEITLMLGDMATLLSDADSRECVAALSPRTLQLRWAGAVGSSTSLKVALTLSESTIPIPDGCTLRLESRLEMVHVRLEPFGTQNRALTPAATAFEWQVRPLAPGEYRGTLWLYLLLADGARLPIYTHPLTLRVLAWLTPLRWLLRLLAGLLLGGLTLPRVPWLSVWVRRICPKQTAPKICKKTVFGCLVLLNGIKQKTQTRQISQYPLKLRACHPLTLAVPSQKPISLLEGAFYGKHQIANQTN